MSDAAPAPPLKPTQVRRPFLVCFALAVLVTFLVGASRVFLGVHYPTDVIGGWIIGLFWASMCWLAAQHYEVRAGLRAERRKSA